MLDDGEPVRLGDGRVVKGQGIGMVRVRVSVEEDNVDYVTLLDVLFVEELAINLLSVAAET